VVENFRAPIPRHHLLSGDVGTGKTVVYGLVAAANARNGDLSAVMLPNQALAGQVAREMGEMWPDLQIELITGVSRKSDLVVPSGGIVVGTTALLTRIPADVRARITLVVVDEQQKFSVAQREHLIEHGAHLLEVTATCIPRTLALARYGAIKVSRLTQPHTPKNIVSRIYQASQKADLFREIRASLAQGNQVLIVYPLKDSEQSAKNNERLAVEQAAQMWERAFPGKVRKIHGAMSDEEKSAALYDLREDRAEILIGTTVVEVGINLPRLRHVVVVDPGRLGLTQLHQIRGRAARNGGEGLFDMYLPTPPAEHTMERLSVLTRTQDGFKVAEDDLRLRGFGDLGVGSERQTGADETFLYGRPIRVDVMDKVAKIIEDRLRSDCA
jgi:ATP-dependent DNA helicase RecG